jgi:peptidoglycan/xylan/chitin deacetylase (PgdA/CDA1 family)
MDPLAIDDAKTLAGKGVEPLLTSHLSCITFWVIILCIFSSPSHAVAQTFVLITVDVESPKGGNPQKDIWGQLDGYKGMYGVPKIIEILKKNNAKATFFLNVYEIQEYGGKPIKGIALEIVHNGQDLQLHTHPKAMYGKSQISNFGFEKQVEILTKGKELIHAWTGRNVIAHRAGDYSADINTIKALKHVDIFVDSSLSPAWSSPLYKEGYSSNDISVIEGVLEIPITYFSQIQIGNWKSIKFLDINSSSLQEIETVLTKMADKGACAVNIMMHSCSFTKHGFPDKKAIDKLNVVLEYINENPKLTTSSVRNFVDLYKKNQLTCTPIPEFVPHTGIIQTYYRSWERFSYGWKNVAFALSIPVLLISLLAVVIIVRRRKSLSFIHKEKGMKCLF